MIYKRNGILITIFLIIFMQLFLYINNKQKSSFRYFIWNIQEISVGKLITISFSTGFLVSSLLSKTINTNDKENFQNDYENGNEEYADQPNEVFKKNEYEIPPQRDVRDTQPTISVNYRVIKNKRDDDSDYDEDYQINSKNNDDWNERDSGW